ncbi:MAG: esterase [Fibrobacteres bacterium]|nr:esterase [Fibrobacterota bacterium]
MRLGTCVLAALTAALWLPGCQLVETKCDKECVDGWLDGGGFVDSCLLDTARQCRVSSSLLPPTDGEKDSLGIIIAVHGFTATSFEWREFADFIKDTAQGYPQVRVSRVVLGGHGQSLDVFRSSTWKDWGKPILEEYDSLTNRGYKRISFACSSTGCPLLMQYISAGDFKKRPAPKWIFMIDPIVVPSAKILSLVDALGPILGNSPDQGDSIENHYWYVNRPEETLKQLYALINIVKNRLEDGFRLPEGTQALVRKSKHDKSADPVGALMIYKGMRKSDGGHVDVQLVDSRLHVFTRLAARSSTPSAADSALQLSTFREMAGLASQP